MNCSSGLVWWEGVIGTRGCGGGRDGIEEIDRGDEGVVTWSFSWFCVPSDDGLRFVLVLNIILIRWGFFKREIWQFFCRVFRDGNGGDEETHWHADGAPSPTA